MERVSKENYYLDIAATVAEFLGLEQRFGATSFLKDIQ